MDEITQEIISNLVKKYIDLKGRECVEVCSNINQSTDWKQVHLAIAELKNAEEYNRKIQSTNDINEIIKIGQEVAKKMTIS
jgi:endonuclease III-like uncharacterized protein